jgi:hypothetical protein
MPKPGDTITAFSVRPGHCFRMVYDYKLQHTTVASLRRGRACGGMLPDGATTCRRVGSMPRNWANY